MKYLQPISNSLVKTSLQITYLVIVLFVCGCGDDYETIDFSFKASSIQTPEELRRASAMAFSLNGKGYILCGRDIAYRSLNDVWQFDPGTQTWSRKNDFPGNIRVKGIAVVCNDTAYVGLGYSVENGHLAPASYFNDFYKYNPDSDLWVQLSSYPSKGVSAAFAFSINGKIYVCTGHNGIDPVSLCFEYSPANDTWKSVAKYPKIVSNAVTGGSGRIFAGTGFYYNITDWHEFNALNSTWDKRSPMPDNGRLSAVCFEKGNAIYVGSGRHWGGDSKPRTVLSTLFRYDIANDSWARVGDLPGNPREGAVVFMISGKSYYGFGEDNNTVLSDFWCLE